MTSGEHWASEQLDALRADRFTPRACARFLSASFERAADTRRARPELARQAHAWSTVGLVSGVAASTAASRLRERLTAADAMTLLRLWLVPFLASQGSRGQRSRPAFAALIVSAAASDGLDGALARRAGPTRLGRDLDTLADALVSAVAARAAVRAGWLPRRAGRLAVIRSSVPAAYAAAIYFRTGRRSLVDSLGGSRQLAPGLLGGLAATPFAPRAGAALTSWASAMSLRLVVVRPTVAYLAHRDRHENASGSTPARDSVNRFPAIFGPRWEDRCHFQPSRSGASRGPAS